MLLLQRIFRHTLTLFQIVPKFSTKSIINNFINQEFFKVYQIILVKIYPDKRYAAIKSCP